MRGVKFGAPVDLKCAVALKIPAVLEPFAVVLLIERFGPVEVKGGLGSADRGIDGDRGLGRGAKGNKQERDFVVVIILVAGDHERFSGGGGTAHFELGIEIAGGGVNMEGGFRGGKVGVPSSVAVKIPTHFVLIDGGAARGR